MGRASRPSSAAAGGDEIIELEIVGEHEPARRRESEAACVDHLEIGGFDQRHYGSAKFVSFLKQDERFEFNDKRDAVRLRHL